MFDMDGDSAIQQVTVLATGFILLLDQDWPGGFHYDAAKDNTVITFEVGDHLTFFMNWIEPSNL
jgi:hypothetical protein